MLPFSHLTSFTPTKSNLYVANSLAAGISEPALYRLLTFHVPNLLSLLRCLDRSRVSVQVRDFVCDDFVTKYVFTMRSYQHHTQPPSWRTTPCRLSATAYSIYSQLLSTSGGRTSTRNMRTRHAVVTGTHSPWDVTQLNIYPQVVHNTPHTAISVTSLLASISSISRLISKASLRKNNTDVLYDRTCHPQ